MPVTFPSRLVTLSSPITLPDIEKGVGNICLAANQMGIGYPIAIDSDYRIWHAFHN